MAAGKLVSKRAKKKDLTVEQQEQVLKRLKENKENNTTQKQKGRFYGRVTVDFPHEVYDAMKEVINEEGRTMKGYLLGLVRKDIKAKQ